MKPINIVRPVPLISDKVGDDLYIRVGARVEDVLFWRLFFTEIVNRNLKWKR